MEACVWAATVREWEMVTLRIYLKIDPTRVADGLDVGCEKEKLNLISRGMTKASERKELPLA